MKSVHLPADPIESAKVAGLRYVTSDSPGMSRRRHGKGWVYLYSGGGIVKNPNDLRRLKSLVIPPAWANVWICPFEHGHLQAFGIDSKGRKQYLYHPDYREIRDATKFLRMAAFGQKLPLLREQVDNDLRLSGLPRRKVLAAVVHLLEKISVRIGNPEYARDNESFGLTTLRNRHVAIDGRTVRFRFKGKSGKDHDIEFTDRRLAKIVALCQELPGQELFQCIEEGCEPSAICSDDVNAYVKELTGEDFTAKDFRTWNGTREAINALHQAGPAESPTEAKRKIVQAVKRVAHTLRNTTATCRKYYIHPAVFDSFTESTLFPIMEKAEAAEPPYGLQREEVALLKIVAGFSPAHLKSKATAIAA